MGDLDGGGGKREPMGAALQGPSLHGRWRVGHRPDDGDVRRQPPAGARRALAARARTDERGARPAHLDPPDIQSIRAATGGADSRQPASDIAGAGAGAGAWGGVGCRIAAPARRVIADRVDRTPPDVEHGPGGPERRQRDPLGPRWDRQRHRVDDRCGGLRELLRSRGEDIEGRDMPVLVPVSVRRPGERGVYNNQVSAMLPTLPVGTEDPVERLQSVRAQMDRLKESGQAVAGEVLTSLSGFAPPLLLALGGRLAARSPSLGVQTGVTNVPGPQQPLQTLGRRLLESFPFVPLIGNVRISIAIFSYNGGLYFGVTGDYDSSSDIDVLTNGVERGVAELHKVSRPAATEIWRRNGRRANPGARVLQAHRQHSAHKHPTRWGRNTRRDRRYVSMDLSLHQWR